MTIIKDYKSSFGFSFFSLSSFNKNWLGKSFHEESSKFSDKENGRVTMLELDVYYFHHLSNYMALKNRSCVLSISMPPT